MRISKFEIENFKGIVRTSVELHDNVPGSVVTLIGLNESGKTTILEALSHFVTEDRETTKLVGSVHQRSRLQDIIPKEKTAAFSGKICIRAWVELDDDDVHDLADFFQRGHKLLLDTSSLARRMSVEKVYEFQDSSFVRTQTLWSIRFPLKKGKAKKFILFHSAGETRAVWEFGVVHLRSRIPNIVYFPTFLFAFPDRIYLEGDDSEINAYYLQILQDVLDSQGEGLSLQRHIVDRLAAQRSKSSTPLDFIAKLMGGMDERTQIDAVIHKISNKMSEVVFGAWSDILGKRVSNKRIQLNWFVDSEKSNAAYLRLSIVDGQSTYALSERSLGFRWFFSFLLFTQFRRERTPGRATVFLFDEPAANLHSKAQMKLLESFSKIAADSTSIIYSTHSHYMVNPLWLEKAYIVDNRAINYEDEDDVNSFAIRRTDIHTTRYRNFVGSNPTRTTYFQPVLDALDIPLSPLERGHKAFIVEGKFDYHPFVYLRRRVGGSESPSIFPGGGAGHLGCLIQLFRGWGVDFRVLLDDDPAGRTAKQRYCREYLIEEEYVVTLGDVDSEFAGLAFDELFMQDVRTSAATAFGSQNPGKREFSLLFQQLLSSDSQQAFPETEARFSKISTWTDRQFQTQVGKSAKEKLPTKKIKRSS